MANKPPPRVERKVSMLKSMGIIAGVVADKDSLKL
jgi:hypothetical protein